MGDGKLVRDGIPKIIEDAGGCPNVQELDEAAYRTALRSSSIPGGLRNSLTFSKSSTRLLCWSI